MVRIIAHKNAGKTLFPWGILFELLKSGRKSIIHKISALIDAR